MWLNTCILRSLTVPCLSVKDPVGTACVFPCALPSLPCVVLTSPCVYIYVFPWGHLDFLCVGRESSGPESDFALRQSDLSLLESELPGTPQHSSPARLYKICKAKAPVVPRIASLASSDHTACIPRNGRWKNPTMSACIRACWTDIMSFYTSCVCTCDGSCGGLGN